MNEYLQKLRTKVCDQLKLNEQSARRLMVQADAFDVHSFPKFVATLTEHQANIQVLTGSLKMIDGLLFAHVEGRSAKGWLQAWVEALEKQCERSRDVRAGHAFELYNEMISACTAFNSML